MDTTSIAHAISIGLALLWGTSTGLIFFDILRGVKHPLFPLSCMVITTFTGITYAIYTVNQSIPLMTHYQNLFIAGILSVVLALAGYQASIQPKPTRS